MVILTPSRIVFRSGTVKAAYQRAVKFCLAVEQASVGSLVQGKLRLENKYLCGQFEFRYLTGSDPALENHSLAAPLLVKEEPQAIDPEGIRLQVAGADDEISLSALISSNCPGFPANLPVRRISLQALSPTSRFWLRWTQAEAGNEEGVRGMLAQGNALAYLKEITAGVNDFYDFAVQDDGVWPKGPFFGSSQDLVGQDRSEVMRLFILPCDIKAEILELAVTAQVSQLGNFSFSI